MSEAPQNIKQAQKILNAAFKCISEKGYANVSLRDIADEAGVVLSQLNYYYKNKEGLFHEIIRTLKQQYLSELEHNLRQGGLEKEGMSSLIEYFQKLLRKKPELFKLLLDLTGMSLWSASLKELLNDLFNSLSGLIEKYVIPDRDKFRDISPMISSKLLLGALFGTSVQVMLAEGKEDIIDSLTVFNILFE